MMKYIWLGMMLMTAPAWSKEPAGVLGKAAPSWRVDAWLNAPDGVDVADYRGKVVYLYAFQSWCPGCHRQGFPTLAKVMAAFEGQSDVAFVAIQTTFEGFEHNGLDDARKTAKRYGLTIPVGHSGTDGEVSRLIYDYRIAGTPWIVIIDKQGVVRYNHFRIKPNAAVELINELAGKEAD